MQPYKQVLLKGNDNRLGCTSLAMLALPRVQLNYVSAAGLIGQHTAIRALARKIVFAYDANPNICSSNCVHKHVHENQPFSAEDGLVCICT